MQYYFFGVNLFLQWNKSLLNKKHREKEHINTEREVRFQLIGIKAFDVIAQSPELKLTHF